MPALAMMDRVLAGKFVDAVLRASGSRSTSSRIACHRRRPGAISSAAAEQVAVEDHVQVLVGGDPGEQLVGDRVSRMARPVLRCETRVASSWKDT